MSPRRKPLPRKDTPTAAATGSALSRRRFVTLVAAGSAVLLARPAAAADRRTGRKPAGTRTAPLSAATQKEFDRQRAGMLSTLKTIREAPLPPGGDLPVVFRPRRTRRAGR